MTRTKPTILLLLSCFTAVAQESEWGSGQQELVHFMQELDLFTRTVQHEYVREVTRRELWDGALRGMIQGLDQFSTYVSQDELLLYSLNAQSTSGFGFGFEWRYCRRFGRLLVQRILPGSQAEQAGLFVDDIIIAINKTSIENTSHDFVRQVLLDSNRQGQRIELDVVHQDQSKDTITIERGQYEDRGVVAERMLDQESGIAYIAISRFLGSQSKDEDADQQTAITATGKDFRRALDRLHQAGLQGLILDLRGNGGGDLLAAVEVADCFLDANYENSTVIVEQTARQLGRPYRHLASSTNSYPEWPLIVLIDERSASSAEIVAAALKDHNRACLVGSTTAGKNSIQQHIVLDSGAALILTVAHFRSPGGQELAGRGVRPHIHISLTPNERLALQRRAWLQTHGKDLPDTLKQAEDRVLKQATTLLTAMLVHQHYRDRDRAR